ncbi:polysaccharide deacetylase family protein [Micromonospora sp. WMMA1363]|uniref:polysaccharide deacetylase family protein n=1 Tax=Micromonospora sp. WMMA1363 TaxID=3053985 RepID=UPI00259CE331|nr:polysaccharide deacetylase family protein [Micromonospora sp. WMMA1363]MDM4719431.1 polysaccharide deacetylase family protein [Micromonospora sp. WMMA1363]
MVARSGLLRPALVLATVGFLANAVPAVASVPAVRQRVFPALAGLGRTSHVALTFDDGPDRASTPRFLRLLAAARVRATFFVLGHMLDRDPGLGREIVAAGHEMAVHGWEHRNLLLRPPSAAYDDIARTRERIAEITGSVPVWYRPPYGVLTVGALAACRRLYLTPRLWTAWGRDWRAGATPASVYRTTTSSLSGGGTVLLHDSDCESHPGAWQATLGALPLLLAWAHDRHLTVGSLGEHDDSPGEGRDQEQPRCHRGEE